MSLVLPAAPPGSGSISVTSLLISFASLTSDQRNALLLLLLAGLPNVQVSGPSVIPALVGQPFINDSGFLVFSQ